MSVCSLFKDLPAHSPQQCSSDTCQNSYSHFVCYFDWQSGLGQHLCGFLRSDSMITTCMFRTLKVALYFGILSPTGPLLFSGYRW